MSVDFDRQAVDVQRQLLGTLAVLQRRQQPRQRGLRRPVLGQGRHPARVAAGQLPERVAAQRAAVAGGASSTRTEPLQEGIQVDRLSPMVDGSLGSGS